jgi:hypothetical protein
MMSIELAVAEDLETHVHEGADGIVVVVKMAAERWRDRHECEFRLCIWNTYVIGNIQERGNGAPELLIRADVINLLGGEINTTKRSTEVILRAGSDVVLKLKAGKIKCVTFSCRWNVG